MKKIPFLCLISFLGMFISCNSQDDEKEKKLVDQFKFGDVIYTINSGLVEDYGQIGFDHYSHYNLDFHITDGVWQLDSTDNYTLINATYWLTLTTYSEGIAGFITGDFKQISLETIDAQDQIDDNNFFDSYISTASLNEVAEGGKLEVIGSGTNYELDFSISFPTGKLEGTYSGPFTYSDQREE